MRRPVHEIRFGYIKVCIWLNQSASGPRHSATAVRIYRDGDVWRESHLFGRDNLLVVCKALDQAHTWMFDHIHVGLDAAPAAAGEPIDREGALSRRPVHEIRFGFIKVCIWLNQTKSGPRHNATAIRLFRDGDVWRQSHIFGRDDLPLVCKALDRAHSWIFEHIQQERAGATLEATEPSDDEVKSSR